MLFNIIKDEIIRKVTERQETGSTKIMVYADDISHVGTK
jgi:hypothetical protein